MNKFKITVFCLLFLLSATFGAKEGQSVQTLRVGWSECPQTEAIVVWNGRKLNKDAVLLYDTASYRKNPSGYAFKVSLYNSGLYLMMLNISPGAIHYSTILSSSKIIDFTVFKAREC